jgi:two-component system, OmpR family, response regulator RegX3
MHRVNRAIILLSVIVGSRPIRDGNGAKAMTTHILVVQSDLTTDKLLRFLLPEKGYQMTMLADPRAVGPLLREKSVNLVLLDVALPYIDGFTLCATIRGEHPDIPVIFLTERDTLQDKVRGFSQGADDYIPKPFEPNELLARIQAVLHRYRRAEGNRSSIVVRVGDTSLDLGKMQFTAAAHRPILLTPTEMKLLECLMRNANVVVSRKMLIERTHGDHSPEGSNRTDVYIRRLRKKVEANPDDPKYIHTVRGVGYIYRDARSQEECIG